ncbi:MAG: hypothetical protein K0R52_1329 [Alphaproteobacteria bacterium]|jgi:hypothetical protein|nr:hypothetical protein [Alphaproteobacteria bacterium]
MDPQNTKQAFTEPKLQAEMDPQMVVCVFQPHFDIMKDDLERNSSKIKRLRHRETVSAWWL